MLDHDEDGLTEAEAGARLAQFGPNRLAEDRGEPLWAKVLEELREPMILLLLITGALYALLGEPSDAVVIALIIAALLTIEIANERRAARAVAALRALAEPTAVVRRSGAARDLPSEQVVPGDLVLLQAGRRVPADARLVAAYGLAVDEAALTGESLPVDKRADAPEERAGQVFAGTTVARGRGAALVTTTGPATELGRVAGLARAARPPRTALQLAMRRLSGSLVWVALGFSLLIPLLGVLIARQPPEQMLLTGLSLAFATIPEELPIIITMVLALGAYRLSRQRAVVKRLQAVESLGAITVVATDKTGTLTENRMALRLLEPSERARELLELGLLASAGSPGDPLEAGLARAAEEAGLDGRVRRGLRLRDEHSFDAGRRLVSLVYEADGGLRIAAKGAPEAVLARADRWNSPAGVAPLDEAQRQALLERAAALADQGLRVIALAERSAPAGPLDREEAERGLVFMGLAGFADPARPEAAAAVAACRTAGIRTLMITGDHPLTARAVAAQIGLGRGEQLLTGAELDALGDDALEQTVAQIDLYARATPEHKLRIVQALQRRGERVAVTGDGINDAPALAAADIGIAMGASGTDVARAAAGVILTDDNFATLGAALREGRTLFANLRKGVRYYLACKVGLISAALLPALLGLPAPFAPVQIILLELFMDVAAAAAFVAEPAEPGSMDRPPRDPRAPFLDRALIVGILVAGLGLGAAVSFAHLGALWTGAGLAQAQTGAFFTWLLGHMLLALNLRTERAAVLRLRAGGNRIMAGWALATVAFVLLAASLPLLQGALRTAPLGGTDWLRVIIAAAAGASWLALYQLVLPTRPAPDGVAPAARSS